MYSMLHSKNLDKERINTILENFSQNYEKIGGKEELDIYLVGGAAILLNFEYRESTIDVDALFKENDLVQNAIAITAKEIGIDKDWLNQDCKKTPSYSPLIQKKCFLFSEFGKHVKVYVLEPIYLIAMKLKSSRPTGGDLDDIIKMVYELRLKEAKITYDDVIKAYLELYGDFSNTYTQFLVKTKEAFEISINEIKEITQKTEY